MLPNILFITQIYIYKRVFVKLCHATKIQRFSAHSEYSLCTCHDFFVYEVYMPYIFKYIYHHKRNCYYISQNFFPGLSFIVFIFHSYPREKKRIIIANALTITGCTLIIICPLAIILREFIQVLTIH